jgi:hypothetical protein
MSDACRRCDAMHQEPAVDDTNMRCRKHLLCTTAQQAPCTLCLCCYNVVLKSAYRSSVVKGRAVVFVVLCDLKVSALLEPGVGLMRLFLLRNSNI